VSVGGSHDAALSTGHSANTSTAHDPTVSADYSGASDIVIEGDGTSSNTSGLPGAQEVANNNALTTFESAFSVNRTYGILMFESDNNSLWSIGDTLVLELGTIDGLYNSATDVIMLSGNSTLSNGDPASFQLLLVGDLLGILFHDANSNGSWDDGEDIVLDANHNDLYQSN
jgi:hypothetical protein